MNTNNNPSGDNNQPKMPKFNMNWIYILVLLAIIGVFMVGGGDALGGSSDQEATYTKFKEYVQKGYAQSVVINKNDNTLKLLIYSEQGPALEKALTESGVPHQRTVYNNAAHGIGLGYGTDAEGWLDDAAAFWEAQTAE